MKYAKWFFFLFLAVSVMFTGCSKKPAGEDEKIVLKISTPLPAGHPISDALEFFKDRLAEESNGKMQARLFLNGQLGKSAETVELCQGGSIEMVSMSAAILTQFVPELYPLCMPFIFRDSRHAYKVVDGPIGKLLTQKTAKHNLQTLAFFDAGSRSIMTKTGPVTRPEELKGMKIRVMSSPLMIDTINALGAAGIPMSQGEVYTALQTGVLDGWENNPPTTLSFRMHETGCIYYAKTEHLMIPDMLIINKELYDGLDDQLRDSLDRAAAETMLRERQLWQQSEQQTIEKLKEAGMKFNEVEKDLFIEKVKPVYRQYYEKRSGEFKDICQRIKASQ